MSAAVLELRQLTESVTPDTEEDEFDTFARYLALSLKKMPIHLALQCETELQATLNRYRLMAVTPIAAMTPSTRSSSSSTYAVEGSNYTCSDADDTNSSFPQTPSPYLSYNVPSSNERGKNHQYSLSTIVAEAISDI